MSYSHLSIIERSKLEILHRQGKSSRAIAKELGRHSSTICRELDRVNSSHPYQAEHAQNAYEERRKASVSPGKWSDSLAASLEEKLEATWSPEGKDHKATQLVMAKITGNFKRGNEKET
ncbi:helix-turn-helix domain-containing protein [Paenibacillus sp. Z3-2]